nr:MAG TPA: hypothetical protein [Caudoviricetes sp.]
MLKLLKPAYRLFQKSGDTTYCFNDDLPSFLP